MKFEAKALAWAREHMLCGHCKHYDRYAWACAGEMGIDMVCTHEWHNQEPRDLDDGCPQWEDDGERRQA